MTKITTLICGILFIGALAFSLTVSNARVQSFEENFAVESDSLPQEDASGVYDFDKAHSNIHFRIKHLGLVDVLGSFRDFSGTVQYDAKGIKKSSVAFTAKVTSIDTGIAARDNHLRTADFFEVEKFPEMSFKSTKVEKKGKDFIVYGDFTLKGVTKPIMFPFKVFGPVKDQRGGVKMGFVAETTINRRDYGINYGSNLPNGTPAIDDNVRIDLQIEANMKK
jgi:polyisoprenoid-binding protein YceI